MVKTTTNSRKPERCDILSTLEALIPQVEERCQAFYREHQPRDTHPLAAYAWVHRELIARFGVKPVLAVSGRIAQRLQVARHDALTALEVPDGR